jgi:signal transduction histidine kinase/AmiR/NasT family two-component response regulator
VSETYNELISDHFFTDHEWAKLTAGEPVQFEIRLKRPFKTEEILHGEAISGDTVVLAAAYADKTEDGTVKGVLGCLTDISRQKWVEGFQARRTDEAIELKRQQENFMDMTSHEARNPLSAITLCAESILTTLKELLNTDQDIIHVAKDTIETHHEGAEIIMACAQHQKRIIDDVLTLSKLDSGLLVICPIEVQPVETIKQALNMFSSELIKSDIRLEYDLLPTYLALNIDWVRLDPSRLLQILINLITNAIKFTASSATREIVVSVGASVDRPSNFSEGLEYLADPNTKDPTSPRADNEVYLTIAVKDTGKGISPEEMKGLFQRFQQASPKTHIKYGGSGLGLFISRELASRQGGQIGVASQSGRGSTFAFYVMAHRCEAKNSHHDASKVGSGARKRSKAEILTAAAAAEEELQSHVTHELASRKAGEIEELATTELHLLVVEDNLVNQKVMSNQLKRAGYIVAVANHGHEALEHVRKSRFADATNGLPLHIVLCDVEMPVLDGLGFVRLIREMEAKGSLNAHIPVIAVTANARAEQQAAALEAGMDSVVTKPFRMLELLPELERVRKLHST